METEPPDEDQVIGVLARCDVCGEKTVHVDGVCRDHKIVRRRRRPAVASLPVGALESRRARLAAERAADAEAAARRSGRSGLRKVTLLIVAGGLIWLLGATHILHGERSGVAFCWKAGWSLGDTFVDTDQLATQPQHVRDALAACAY